MTPHFPPSCSTCEHRTGERCTNSASAYNGKAIKAWHHCRAYEEKFCINFSAEGYRVLLEAREGKGKG